MGSAEIQGELWGRNPRTWAELQESQMRPIYDATLDAAGPLTGKSLLDAGCGAGLVVSLAVGRGAVASGLDASAPLLEVARGRTPGASFRTGETEALFARLRSLAPPPPGTPAPLAVSDPGMVEGLLEKAGLAVTGGGEVPVGLSYADHDQAWTAHISAGPLQKVIDVAGPDAVRQVMHDVLEADRKPDGQLRQDNVFRYVLAAKP